MPPATLAEPQQPASPPAGPNTARPKRPLLRRLRVPLGFATAAAFLLLARPTGRSLLLGLLPVLAGLALRGYAAGYVRKNAELTRTGPYAYTRNPLYLGSLLLTLGVGVAGGRWWLPLLLCAFFLSVYIPTILSEETFLRTVFPSFPAYAAAVPRLLPRLTPARFPDLLSTDAGRFSPARYRHHREYNALVGAAALYAVLALRMWLSAR